MSDKCHTICVIDDAKHDFNNLHKYLPEDGLPDERFEHPFLGRAALKHAKCTPWRQDHAGQVRDRFGGPWDGRLNRAQEGCFPRVPLFSRVPTSLGLLPLTRRRL